MAEATFRTGDPIMVDYTPAAGNITGGQVVLLGNTAGITCGVAHRDIENTKLGAIAIGHGCYDGINLDNAANWVPIWWDDAVNKYTTTSTNNAKFGYVVSGGGGGANSICRAFHEPRA